MEKVLKTGNPVRQDLLDIDNKRAEAIQHYGLDPDKKTLVVLGGSLGARVINLTVEKYLNDLLQGKVQLIWQTGKLYYEEYKKYGDRQGVQVREYIQRMDLLYAAADILISRAGAGTISELCIVGKPVIFIPSPNVAEDHQTKNARALADRQAAILLRESEIDRLPQVFADLLSDEIAQGELGENIKKLALPDATKRIADEVEKLVK